MIPKCKNVVVRDFASIPELYGSRGWILDFPAVSDDRAAYGRSGLLKAISSNELALSGGHRSAVARAEIEARTILCPSRASIAICSAKHPTFPAG
jgi:hypothetical protein